MRCSGVKIRLWDTGGTSGFVVDESGSFGKFSFDELGTPLSEEIPVGLVGLGGICGFGGFDGGPGRD